MFTRSPKFINLKTDPAIFATKPNQPTTINTTTIPTLQSTNTQTTSNKYPWLLWSAILWLMFILGFVLMIAGFYKSLTNKNTVSDKTKADKPYKDLAIAMLVIGFVLCFITFIVSVVTGIRMF
jgi:ABC-type Fe3+ transport system permease subunit